MKLFANVKAYFSDYLHQKHEGLAIAIFCKSLYVFLVLKIVFIWSVLPENLQYFPYEFQSLLHYIIYAPINLAQYNASVFLLLMLTVLLAGLVLRVNYVTGVLILWLSFSLTRLGFPLVNGSDYVLNLFLFLSIFLSVTPAFKSESLRSKQQVISNFTFLVCKIQLCLIYVFSGFDKLISAAWRSGDAVFSITNLEYFISPHLSIPTNKSLYLVLAWLIIVFELSFPIMVWFKRLRVYALAGGVVFHLVIIFALSLPDFGLLMLLMYSLFISFGKQRKLDHPINLR